MTKKKTTPSVPREYVIAAWILLAIAVMVILVKVSGVAPSVTDRPIHVSLDVNIGGLLVVVFFIWAVRSFIKG